MAYLDPGDTDRTDTEPRGLASGRRTGRPGLPRPLGGTSEATGAQSGPDPIRIVEILSHELRSPITTIHLGTKVLASSGGDIPVPVRAEVVEAVEEEAERLYRLVEDLLAVAQHNSGNHPLSVRPLLLQHWMLEIIDGAVRNERRLRVRVAVPADLPPVLADDGALAHAIRNLLANAARYAADGMPVEVVARRGADGTIHVDVLDRGPGFDLVERDLLFEPFYRTAAASATGSGAGLGLAAARRLMRAMGGDLEALPRDGGGSRFRLVIAIARPDDEPEANGGMGAGTT